MVPDADGTGGFSGGKRILNGNLLRPHHTAAIGLKVILVALIGGVDGLPCISRIPVADGFKAALFLEFSFVGFLAVHGRQRDNGIVLIGHQFLLIIFVLHGRPILRQQYERMSSSAQSGGTFRFEYVLDFLPQSIYCRLLTALEQVFFSGLGRFSVLTQRTVPLC